jgi:arginine deiminase
VLEYKLARQQAIGAALAGQVRRHLEGLDPEALTELLITGLTAGEFRSGRGAVYQLLGASDFILRPQPDLVFFRDQSVWIGDQVAVASPAAAGRRLPAEPTRIVYAHHPLFAGTKSLYQPGLEPLHGGDLLLAARA